MKEIVDLRQNVHEIKTKLESERAAGNPTHTKLAQENVDAIRPLLTQCAWCAEGRHGGYYVNIGVDEEGRVRAIEGHDVATQYVDPTRTNNEGLRFIAVTMYAADWDPKTTEAFIDSRLYPSALSSDAEMKINALMRELNAAARHAWELAKFEEPKPAFVSQSWFSIMTDKTKYPTQLLLFI